MWSNSLELRFPVAQNILGVDAFFDAVAIKSDVKTMFTTTYDFSSGITYKYDYNNLNYIDFALETLAITHKTMRMISFAA